MSYRFEEYGITHVNTMEELRKAVDDWRKNSLNENRTIVHKDGVTVIFEAGTEIWKFHHQVHRDDGPAITKSNGDQIYYKNGHLHRLDGPACISGDGKDLRWYQNGLLHRDDGPAEIRPKDYQAWYQNGQMTRSTGTLEPIHDKPNRILTYSISSMYPFIE
jgi:hypothetical protein